MNTNKNWKHKLVGKIGLGNLKVLKIIVKGSLEAIVHKLPAIMNTSQYDTAMVP